MIANLINIGRNKISKIVEVKDWQQLYNELGKYILSRDYYIVPSDNKENHYTVMVGHLRTIGFVEIIRISKQENAKELAQHPFFMGE